jgi:deoxyribonuclease IV
VLLETTAGAGSVLGARFEELAEMIGRIGAAARARVGVCVDTCHLWAAGYDLAGDYDGVMARLEDTIGPERVRLFHLNDSLGGLGSRRDRHAGIGQGALGDGPFRRLMNDPRFAGVPRVLETPKGDDPVAADRANLARLRGFVE